jgi:putative ABC transport system ATP-binding protein
MSERLIHIEGLTKVFYTDEIETHALSGIHLSIARGEYIAMSGSRRRATVPMS